MDEILSKPVGEYTTNGVKMPVYAARRTTLPFTTPDRSHPYQVLVEAFGGLQWINVNPEDVVLQK